MTPPRGVARVLLLASNFPPVRGGSAVVYDSLARHSGGAVMVMAPRLNYADGQEFAQWRAHDAAAPYRVVRPRLLRSPLRPGGPPRGLARGAAWLADLAQRLVIAGRLAWTILTSRIACVCIGEVLASAWIIACLRWYPGLRVVAYVHGEELTTEDPWDPGHRRARAALLGADRVIVVSRFTAAAAAALVGAEAARRIATIPNGVDLDRFRLGPPRADLQDRHGLRGCFTFVTVCRLVEKKGVDQTIRALSELPADCRLVVVGAGPFEARLREIAQEFGVAHAVVFAGAVAPEELADHYRLGDVFVMPNRAMPNGDTEGFGLVFLEANACGLPVIAGRDGGSTEAVQDGVNGLVVDGHSAAAVAAAMRRLHADAALRDRLRAGGLAAAAAADWRLKARAFLDLCLAPG